MALPILSILRTVAPLAAKATEILATYATLQRQGNTLALEERVRRLEEELVQASDVLRSTTQQLLALAEQVRIQQRRLIWLAVVTLLTIVLAVASLIVAT